MAIDRYSRCVYVCNRTLLEGIGSELHSAEKCSIEIGPAHHLSIETLYSFGPSICHIVPNSIKDAIEPSEPIYSPAGHELSS